MRTYLLSGMLDGHEIRPRKFLSVLTLMMSKETNESTTQSVYYCAI